MTARPIPIDDALIGLLPIALVLGAVAGARGVRHRAARRCCRRRAGVHAARPAARLRAPSCSTSRPRCSACSPAFAIAVVIGCRHRPRGDGQPDRRRPLVRPIVRVLAPVPKIALYPAFMLHARLRPCLQDRAGRRRRAVPDPALRPIRARRRWSRSWSGRRMAAGTSRRRCLFTVVLPAALPSVLTGCRIGLVISCIVVFLAEMITSTDGLGHLLVHAARTSRPSTCSCR